MVPMPPQEVFNLLADLDCHHLLTDDGMQIVRLHGPVGARTGGLVELRGPIGLRRRVATVVGGSAPPSKLWGTAHTRSGSHAVIRWHLRPDGPGTHVRVELDITAAARDRALLACGGRLWLRRRACMGLRWLAAAYASGGRRARAASLSKPAASTTTHSRG